MIDTLDSSSHSRPNTMVHDAGRLRTHTHVWRRRGRRVLRLDRWIEVGAGSGDSLVSTKVTNQRSPQYRPAICSHQMTLQMNRRGSRVDRGAPQAVGGSAAAAAAEAAAFEDAIRAYFRVGVLPKSKSRKRPRTAVQEPEDERDRPATHLKRIKQFLRDASPAAQTELIQRVLDAVLVQLRPKKTSPTAFERVCCIG